MMGRRNIAFIRKRISVFPQLWQRALLAAILAIFALTKVLAAWQAVQANRRAVQVCRNQAAQVRCNQAAQAVQARQM